MKKWLGVSLVALLIGVTIYTTWMKEPSVAEGIKIGDKAPDFKLRTLEGDVVNLSDYDGKRVLVNFWATWCPPCIKETPDMVAYYKAHQKEGIEILSVNLTSTETGSAPVEAFVEKYEMPFKTVLDAMDEVSKVYQIAAVPTSYFIDADGIIHKKVEGGVSSAQLQQIFNEMR